MTTFDPIIASIPHCGTRFLKERLGVEDHVHTNLNWPHLWPQVQGRHIISPLRRPDAVWRSWCRRRADDEVMNWVGPFFLCWAGMHLLDQLFDIDYVIIDKQEDERISDWNSVGSDDSDHARWKLHKVDLRQIYKFPFVHRFYPSHLK